MTPPYPEKQHSGQTVIVTGANVGLGLEAARHFTRLNAEKVVLAVRSTEKGEIAKKSIEETARRQGVVEVWPMDLSSYESVKQFAKRVEGLKRLDALVENAGIATRIFKTAEDNESTISEPVYVVTRTLLTTHSNERGQHFPVGSISPPKTARNCFPSQHHALHINRHFRGPRMGTLHRKR